MLRANPILSWERFLAVCFFVFAALACAAVALELGAWVHDETFTAPFAVSSSGTNVVPVWGGTANSFFWVRSDSDGGDADSDLRASINGVELRPHSNITETMDGFSHWGAFVYFNKTMASQPASKLHIHYSIRVRPWVLYTIIILLVLFSWCTASSTYIGYYITAAYKLFLFVLRAVITLLALLALLAVTSTIAGLVAESGLYPIYAYERLYSIWPSLKSLISIEPYVPLSLISLSLAIATSSWLLGRTPAATSQAPARPDELKAVDSWVKWGFPAILGLLLTSVILGAWSGNVIQLDLPYMNIAGLVPNSDPMGYLAEALNLFHNGQTTQFGARRMLATILLGWISFLAQGSYVTITIVQCALVTTAIYVASVAVLRWRGVAACICFVAFAYIIARPFVITTLTEAVAVSIAFLAVPFFVYGLTHKSNTRLLLGFSLINIAMLIRPGAVFCLPAFVAWAMFFSDGPFQRRLKFASSSAAVVCGAFLLNVVMTRLFCPDATSVDVALPYLLCGLSLGATYHQCEARYATELGHLGEAAQATVLYAIAWKNILANPQLFLTTILRISVQFLIDLPKLLFRGYTTWRWDAYFPILLVYGFSCLGWLTAARQRLDWRLAVLVGLFFSGNLVSAAFLYVPDGWRVFIISYPSFALLIAGGLYSQQSVETWRSVRFHRLGRIVSVVMFAAAVLLLGPAVIARYHLAAEPTPAVTLAPGQVLISHQRPLVGFLVVPDSTQPSPKIPSIQIGLFRKFLEAGQFLREFSMENFPKTPFGFIFPAEVPLHHLIYNDVVVPPEVILQKDVPAWKLRVAPFNEFEGWLRATEAEPAP